MCLKTTNSYSTNLSTYISMYFKTDDVNLHCMGRHQMHGFQIPNIQTQLATCHPKNARRLACDGVEMRTMGTCLMMIRLMICCLIDLLGTHFYTLNVINFSLLLVFWVKLTSSYDLQSAQLC